MSFVEFHIEGSTQSPVLPIVRSNLDRLSLQQHFLAIRHTDDHFSVVDIRTLDVLSRGKCTNAISTTCFQPWATFNDPQKQKIVLHLKSDRLVLNIIGTTVNQEFLFKEDSSIVFFGDLFVSRSQNVFFAGRSSKSLHVFCFNGETIKRVVSGLNDNPLKLNVVISDFDNGASLVLSQGHHVRFIRLDAFVPVEHEFLLDFSPSSCHVFKDRILSFFNATTNTVHNFVVDKKNHSSVSPRSINSLGPRGSNLQCMRYCSEDLFVWNGETHRFSTFFVESHFIPFNIDNVLNIVSHNKTKILSLKQLCGDVIKRNPTKFCVEKPVHKNRQTCIGTAHLFDVVSPQFPSSADLSQIVFGTEDDDEIDYASTTVSTPQFCPSGVLSVLTTSHSNTSNVLTDDEADEEIKNFAASFVSTPTIAETVLDAIDLDDVMNHEQVAMMVLTDEIQVPPSLDDLFDSLNILSDTEYACSSSSSSQQPETQAQKFLASLDERFCFNPLDSPFPSTYERDEDEPEEDVCSDKDEFNNFLEQFVEIPQPTSFSRAPIVREPELTLEQQIREAISLQYEDYIKHVSKTITEKAARVHSDKDAMEIVGFINLMGIVRNNQKIFTTESSHLSGIAKDVIY